jgi:hypothetical protein
LVVRERSNELQPTPRPPSTPLSANNSVSRAFVEAILRKNDLATMPK